MNCEAFHDNLAAYFDGLLSPAEAADFEQHQAACPACREAMEQARQIHDALTTHAGQSDNMETQVMSRIFNEQHHRLGRIKMRNRFIAACLSAAAVVLVGVGIVVFRPAPRATAAEVMTRGIQAAEGVASIHLAGRLRTLPADNFSQIGLEYDFQPVEIWKELVDPHRSRMEKPGRVIVCDGTSTTMFIRPSNLAVRIDQPTQGAFDSRWLHEIVDIGRTLSHHLKIAEGRSLPLVLEDAVDERGRELLCVSMTVPANVPEDDYARNKFIFDAETIRTFIFDPQTDRLVGMEIHVVHDGQETLIFETTEIEYNVAMDPPTFQLALSEDVRWYSPPQVLPDNEKYERMTPTEAARAFFEACSHEDWDTVAVFLNAAVDERTRSYLGGLELVELGEPFTSQGYPGWFIPYKIRLRDDQEIEHNLAMRKDNPANRFVVDGGI